MTAQQYIRRMYRNLAGTVLVMLATALNMYAGATGQMQPVTYAAFSVVLFVCAVLTIYWTRKDRKLSPFYKGEE